MSIPITRTGEPKKKPEGTLPFGKIFTDHMFLMDYSGGKWHSPRIVPYAPFCLSPAAAVLHYAQEIFEGLKAYNAAGGAVTLFRAADNFKRLNLSCERLCIPPVDEAVVTEGLLELIKLDADWVPKGAGESLYIRPAIIATEESLGVHASESYLFFIIMSPVGAYYANGFAPVRLLVEEDFVRSVRGGTGHQKVGGNYAASYIAGERAEKLGCDQVLWLDAVTRRGIEEVGSMNIFFEIDGKIVTPELSGSILSGITRRSVITLLKDSGRTVEERRVTLDEVLAAAASGALTDCFGTGTAAVISPVGEILAGGKPYKINGGAAGKTALWLFDTLTGIQTGAVKDGYGWVTTVLPAKSGAAL